MEIKTTWNAEFEFDLQKFADLPTSIALSALNTSGLESTKTKLVYNTGTKKYSWENSDGQDLSVTVAEANYQSTTLQSITLKAIANVTADEGVKTAAGVAIPVVTAASIMTTFKSKSDTNKVKLVGGATATITVSGENLTFATTDTDKAVSVEKGSAIIGLPEDFNSTVTADVVYTFVTNDIGSNGANVTFSKTAGITATTEEVKVSAADGGKVFGYDLTGKATLTADEGITLANDATFASATAKDVVVANGAKVTINGWTVEATTAANTPTATVTTAAGKTSGVTKIARDAGVVTVTATSGFNNTNFTAGNTDYKLAKDSKTAIFTFTDKNSTVTTGSFYLDSTSTASSITGSATDNAATATSGNVIVDVATGAVTQITDLGASESVSVTTATGTFTLKANSSGLVTYTDSTGTKYFQLENGATTANMTSAVWTKTAIDNKAIKNSAGVTLLSAPGGGNIEVANHTANKWFTAAGAAYTSDLGDATAAKLEVSKSGDTYSYNLTVSKDLDNGVGVTIKGVATTVVDNSPSKAKYTITNKAGEAGIQGAGFAVSDEGVISDASGTVTLLNSGAKALYLSGSVNVDTTAVTKNTPDASEKVLTYVAGSGLTDTKVTLTDASPIIINEGTNDTDTVIYQTGKIVGLDAGGSVKNAFNTTIETAGSDTSSNTYTINGVEWTVTGDEKTTFTVADGNSSQLASITNLDLDATVTTTKKFEQTQFTVNKTSFYNVVSKDGLTFTSTKKDESASVTLNAAGESVTLTNANGNKYTVTSTSDGVTIDGNGKITGLNNGDVVTIHTGTEDAKSTMTLTVSDNKLTVNGVNADGKQLPATTYTLDSGESEFTAKFVDYTATGSAGVIVSNGTAGEAVDGFELGTGSDAKADKKDITSIADGIYIDKDGKTLSDNSSNKAVAQIQTTDDTVTYTEIGDKAQYVSVSDTKHEWNITTNAGKDVISYTGTQSATINSGAGNDSIEASSKSDLHISLGAGKDTVTVGGSGDHTIVAGEGNSVIAVTATGDVRVDATGAGNKQIYHTGKGYATLYGGDGNDTIKAYSTDDSVVGGAGNNVFDVTTTGMKVSDYNVTKDAVSITGASASTVLAASQFLGDGTVSLSNKDGHVLDVSDGTGTNGFYAIAAEGTDGKKQLFGWAQDSGSTIDVSTVAESVILIGNNNDDKADTLMGGTKSDVIYAGEGDAVYGGAGKDLLVLDSTKGNQTVYTATTAGKDTVTGFTQGFEDGDKINFVDGTPSDVTFDYSGTTVTVKDGDGSLTMTGLSTVASGAVELLAANTKVALTGAKGTIKTDSVSYADVYVGDGSAVDFSSVEGGLHVNLANDIAGDANLARFSGITSVKGGTGATTLMGAASAESLVSGGGNTSLWGGAGKDTLVGGNGADMFFIGANDGTDTMVKFTGGTDATSDTLFFLSGITGAKLGTTGVEVTTTNAKAVLSGTNANTAIHYAMDGAEGVAKVGSATANNNFNYDSTVTYYGGGSKSDKIAFASGSTENAEIWLDGSQGKAYASIDVVDGTNTSGNLIVAGDSSSQSIIGGKGDTSLWGGAGNATDTLRSSSTGKTMFWWGAGEGNDLVVSTSADDSVNLYNLQLADVDVANSSITNSGVSLALNDGSKLTVQTSRDMTFSIDGQSWTAQHNSKEWKQNS